MEVICLEDQAFYKLVEQVVSRLQKEHEVDDIWVSTDEAMRLLNITSKTTLQKIRDEGGITFSLPNNKRIYYDRVSILAYLDTHTKDSF